MLQHLFKLFRAAEREPLRTGDQRYGLQMDETCPGLERPTTALLAQILRSALAQKHSECRDGPAVHRVPCEPSSKLSPHDWDITDGKVVRLMPRRRPETELALNPPTHDDNDPGPSAA